MITRRQMSFLTLAACVSPNALAAATPAILYKTPGCGCCEGYADYLREQGFAVKEVATHDLPLIRKERGIPADLEGCHTTIIDNYIVEGHVPIGPVRKLLKERSNVKGISLPGMPEGSPGMTGRKTEPFVIYEIAEGPRKVFARE